jgi:hypothetical protein
MAREKAKNSKTTFMGLGLDPDEEAPLIKLIEKRDLTARRLIRRLLRIWVEEETAKE